MKRISNKMEKTISEIIIDLSQVEDRLVGLLNEEFVDLPKKYWNKLDTICAQIEDLMSELYKIK